MVVHDNTGNLQLIEITSKSVIEETHRANYEEWGVPLDLESYLLREKGCRVSLTSQTTGHTNWGLQKLVPGSNEMTVVSAFESINRPTFVKIKGRPIRQGINHSIGSVFTPAKNRGKGYAGKMIAAGTNKLMKWQVPETFDEDLRQNTLLTLWSDIGDYYAKFGFEKNSSDTLVFNVSEPRNRTAALPKIEHICTEDDVAAFALAEQERFKQLMEAATESDGKTRVAIVPSITAFRYAHWRSVYAGSLITKQKKPPTAFGASTENGSWIIWNHDFLHSKINVMRCQTSPDIQGREAIYKEIAALFEACETEALKYGIKKMFVWRQDIPMSLNSIDGLNNGADILCTNDGIDMKRLEHDLQNRGFNVILEKRDSSLPCWFMNDMDNTEWCFAGNYCWY